MSAGFLSFASIPSLTAGETIPVCRFVSIAADDGTYSSATGVKAIRTTAGNSAIGVSAGFTNRTPNDGSLASSVATVAINGLYPDVQAVAGQPVSYYPYGTICDIEIGDTVTAGQKLMSDAYGVGIPHATDGKLAMAIALRDGASGEKIPCLVIPPVPRGGTYN